MLAVASELLRHQKRQTRSAPRLVCLCGKRQNRSSQVAFRFERQTGLPHCPEVEGRVPVFGYPCALCQNLENRRLQFGRYPCDRPKRLSKLLVPLSIAFVWCYKAGVYLDQLKLIRIVRLKDAKGNPKSVRLYSFFKYGLDDLQVLLLNACKTKHLQQFLTLCPGSQIALLFFK